MNREILFRGKRVDNGEWVEGFYCEFPCNDGTDIPSIMRIENHSIFIQYPIILETRGIYSGLPDKNGRRVFEGDILSVKDNDKEKYCFIVGYGNFGGAPTVPHKGYIGFYLSAANEKTKMYMRFGLRGDICYWLEACECEVIGNIHDNPELMGGEEK